MNNATRTAVSNAVGSVQPTTEEQHQSNMHPLYPNKKGYKPSKKVAVGAVILAKEDISYNLHRAIKRITVRNTGDRPIQVGSHFHFFEVNRYLEFDRDAAFGTHLNIPATTAIRFEPGDEREVELVSYGGKQRVVGFRGLTEGYVGVEDAPTYSPVHAHAMRKMRHEGFLSTDAMTKKHNQDKNKK